MPAATYSGGRVAAAPQVRRVAQAAAFFSTFVDIISSNNSSSNFLFVVVVGVLHSTFGVEFLVRFE